MRPMIVGDAPKKWLTNGGFCPCPLHQCVLVNRADSRAKMEHPHADEACSLAYNVRAHYADWIEYLVCRWWEDRQDGGLCPSGTLTASRRARRDPNRYRHKELLSAVEKYLPQGQSLKAPALTKALNADRVMPVDIAVALAECSGAPAHDPDLLLEIFAFHDAAVRGRGFDGTRWWGPHVSEHASIETTHEITVTQHAHFLLVHEDTTLVAPQAALGPKRVTYVVPCSDDEHGVTLAERVRTRFRDIDSKLASGEQKARWTTSVVELSKKDWISLVPGMMWEATFFEIENAWIGIRSSHPYGPGADLVLSETVMKDALPRVLEVASPSRQER